MNRLRESLSSHLPFVSLIVGLAILGLFISGNYGEAADDESLQIYAQHTLSVYQGLTRGEFLDPAYDILSYYGPAFVTFIQVFQNLFPTFDPYQVWHFITFLSFLIGAIAIYDLGLNLFPKTVAFSVSALYLVQPLLWGQGFVNAKDTPLAAFILLSISVGVKLTRLFPHAQWQTLSWLASLQKDWKKLPKASQQRWVDAAYILAAILVLALICSFFLNSWVLTFLEWLSSQQPGSWLHNLFLSLAPNADTLPLAGYAGKASVFVGRGVLLVLGLIVLLFLAKAARVFARTIKSATRSFREDLISTTPKLFKSRYVWMAGIPVGIATAIRVIGPFGAALVLLFLLIKHGPRSIIVLLPYAIGASLITYLLWPFLWADPLGNFLDSIHVMSSFPWNGRVLFEGDLYRPEKLPMYYLPSLLAIQFTLPALLLIAGGIVLAFQKRWRTQLPFILMLAAWIVIPLGYVMLSKPVVYHNFRQFLFMVPPLFLFAGFALTWLYERLNRGFVYAALFALALTPGLIAIAQLHPYEYVYYNELAGGLQGAQGRYEMEYWRTSLAEATHQLNQIAEPNSLVVSWGSAQIVRHLARTDLQVELLNARTYDASRSYDYVVVPVRGETGRFLFGKFPEVITVSRFGVPFAVVNQLNCGCATLDPIPPSIFK